MPATNTDTLWGMKDIRMYLRDRHGFVVTRESLYRKSKRAESPFPLRSQVKGKRAHACASKAAIDAWVEAIVAV